MDSYELQRAAEWIAEFGFWRPGAPTIRPAMLKYEDDEERQIRKRHVIEKACRRLTELEVQGCQFFTTAISVLSDCEIRFNAEANKWQREKIKTRPVEKASYRSTIMHVEENSCLPRFMESDHVG